MENLYPFLVLSAAIGAISVTITKASIFKSTREWVKDRSSWFGDLVSCPYCMSHWVAFAGVSYYQPFLINSSCVAIDWVATVFAAITISSIFGGLIIRSYK